MHRALFAISLIGLVAVLLLQTAAKFGHVVGGAYTLFACFFWVLVSFGSAIAFVIGQGVKEKNARPDFGRFVQQPVGLLFIAVAIYGWSAGFGKGRVTLGFGEELTVEKAVLFYGMLVFFFCLSSILQMAAKNQKESNQSPHRTATSRRL